MATTPALAASASYTIALPSEPTFDQYLVFYPQLDAEVSTTTPFFSFTLPDGFFDVGPIAPNGVVFSVFNSQGDVTGEAEFSGATISGNFEPGTISAGELNTLQVAIAGGDSAVAPARASQAEISFVGVVDPAGTDPLVLNDVDLDREILSVTDGWGFDEEAPLTVRPGDTITFTAPAGTFSEGPLGTWTLEGLEVSTSVTNFGPSSFGDLQIAPDGTSLMITVPRPHWGFSPADSLIVDASLFQSVQVSPGRFAQSGIFISHPIDYAAAPAPNVDRVVGPDRFTVSQNIARESYPSGAQTVYITNGLNYPDALSAAPAAAFEGGPLLLTFPTAMPAGLEQTIRDLDPDTIVVVGGPNSVTADVYNQLSTLVDPSNITRLGGTDRFDASRTIARSAFGGTGSSTAFIATGLNFPDALSASAAAGSIGAPVILVNGTQPTLDSATLQVLDDLGVDLVYIAGGPNSVPSTVETQLSTIGFGVERLSGADRFEASSNIARVGFPTAERAFLATGFNFPDALAGAAWAASTRSPLIVVPGACVPTRVLADLSTYQVSDVTILGGPNSVSAAVENLTPCAGFAWDAAAPVAAIDDGDQVRAGFTRTREVLELDH